jgi:hypothetical protein
MARINIEDSLWKDNRFQDLLILVKNRHTAKGMILELWTVAQKYWLTSKGRGIPKPAWKREGLPDELIAAGLARDDGEFIYAIGSKEQFAWLDSVSEKGKLGGPAAAKARRKKTGKTKRQATSGDNTERPITTSPSISLSDSSSPSDSSSGSSSNYFYSVGEGAGAPPAPPGIKSPVGFFVANYVNAFQGRYGGKARPALSGKVQGQIKRFLEDTRLDRACELIQTYCQMDDAWFLTKCHDFGTFIENLGKVGIALDTGIVMTQTQIRQADKAAHAQDQLRRIQEGTL